VFLTRGDSTSSTCAAAHSDREALQPVGSFGRVVQVYSAAHFSVRRFCGWSTSLLKSCRRSIPVWNSSHGVPIELSLLLRCEWTIPEGSQRLMSAASSVLQSTSVLRAVSSQRGARAVCFLLC
jgi:hypothetical protein